MPKKLKLHPIEREMYPGRHGFRKVFSSFAEWCDQVDVAEGKVRGSSRELWDDRGRVALVRRLLRCAKKAESQADPGPDREGKSVSG